MDQYTLLLVALKTRVVSTKYNFLFQKKNILKLMVQLTICDALEMIDLTLFS